MAFSKSPQANAAIVGIFYLQMTVFTLATLYFGQEIIIPLALAILLTFLLSPIVTRFEQVIGRIPAVLTTVFILFIIMSFTGYILSMELVDLTSQFPSYKGNIDAKFNSIAFLHNDYFLSMWHELQNIPKSAIPEKLAQSATITEIIQSLIGALIHIIANIGFVLLLVIFMLLNRVDLKARIIRLIGRGRISATTLALEDAGQRISHYLLTELIINFSFGSILTFGLYLIGIPNAILWGILLMVLRFIPYIGTWIAASIPVILSVIVSPSWLVPLFTVGLYLVLDLICTNFLEPWLYGARTGISSTALILAAVFWTLLWGPVGLLLAIPLTVCLVVMGSYVPQLEFLNILLGDDKPLEVHEQFYHQLLTEYNDDDFELLDKYLKDNTLISFYDDVAIPLIIKISTDVTRDELTSENAQSLYQNILDIIDSNEDISKVDTKAAATQKLKVLCVPARALRDELAGAMLTQIFHHQSFHTENLSCELKTHEILSLVKEKNIDVICIPVVYPSTLMHARFLCKKLLENSSGVKIIVCLFGSVKNQTEIHKKLVSIGVDATVISINAALQRLEEFAKSMK